MRIRGWVAGAVAVTGCGRADSLGVAQLASDTWSQGENDRIDVLFMVDDSGSMGEEQQHLADGFGAFFDAFLVDDVDLHLGLVSSSLDPNDPNGGMLIGTPPFLTADDDLTEFEDRVLLGTDGSDYERGLASVDSALADARNPGFFRDAARLLLVFVSDEDDCSDDYTLLGEPAESCYEKPSSLHPVADYVQGWQASKVDPADVEVASIVALDDSCSTATEGERYLEASAYAGGIVGDICEADWTDLLAAIGTQTAPLRSSFPLSRAARVDAELSVFVDENGTDEEPDDETADDVEVDQDATDGWTYDPNPPSIVFHGSAVPATGSTIFAFYDADPLR